VATSGDISWPKTGTFSWPRTAHRQKVHSRTIPSAAGKAVIVTRAERDRLLAAMACFQFGAKSSDSSWISQKRSWSGPPNDIGCSTGAPGASAWESASVSARSRHRCVHSPTMPLAHCNLRQVRLGHLVRSTCKNVAASSQEVDYLYLATGRDLHPDLSQPSH
jgi:hypothetical protein